jgi:hypothetical protein
MVELELNKPYPVTVPADEAWYHTGLLLRANCVYTMEVIPATQTWRDGKRLGDFTARGKAMPWLTIMYLWLRMPSVKWFALLGCIDENKKTYFKIGIKKEGYAPPLDGELTCFANDALGHYKNGNSGEMKLVVTRIN